MSITIGAGSRTTTPGHLAWTDYGPAISMMQSEIANLGPNASALSSSAFRPTAPFADFILEAAIVPATPQSSGTIGTAAIGQMAIGVPVGQIAEGGAVTDPAQAVGQVSIWMLRSFDGGLTFEDAGRRADSVVALSASRIAIQSALPHTTFKIMVRNDSAAALSSGARLSGAGYSLTTQDG